MQKNNRGERELEAYSNTKNKTKQNYFIEMTATEGRLNISTVIFVLL